MYSTSSEMFIPNMVYPLNFVKNIQENANLPGLIPSKMADIIYIKSISELNNFLNIGKPAHPLITVIRQWPKLDLDLTELKFSSALYYIGMKRDISGAFKYGRNTYDYQEGTMVFIGPGQVATFSPQKVIPETHGWVILFHPDLIRKAKLGKTINNYSFFNYEINEALHLAEKERDYLYELAAKIEQEIHQNIDRHSQDLIIQHLETILKYSNRYYDRQFYTRTNLHKDLVIRFEQYLQAYFTSEELSEKGVPTLLQCGKALNVSGPYLSDLLKVETGKSAKDHIYSYLIELAKTSLLNSNRSVREIAFEFGFEYPQHFSKLFKTKTGMSPSEYRNLN